MPAMTTEEAMTGHVDPEDRLLSVDERSREELQALSKRLRQARDRARRIGWQQKREIRGKADPKGAVPVRDNVGTEAKARVLVEALVRVAAALRKLNGPTQAQLMLK